MKTLSGTQRQNGPGDSISLTMTEDEAEREVRNYDVPSGGWAAGIPEWRQLTWIQKLNRIRQKEHSCVQRVQTESEKHAEREVRSYCWYVPQGGWCARIPDWKQLTWMQKLEKVREFVSPSCEFCGERFRDIANRNRHAKACPRARMCRYCGERFLNRADVIFHEVSCCKNPSTLFTAAECAACGENKQCLRFPCGEHSYCAHCLTKMLHAGLDDRSLLPLRCCKKVVEVGDAVDISLASMLPRKPRLKYQEAMMLHGATHSMYCPNQRCGVLIILDCLHIAKGVEGMRHGWHPEVDVSSEAIDSQMLSSGPGACPKCQQAVCFKCRSEWHEGMSCDQYQWLTSKNADDVTKFCQKMNWMRCFQCGHVVEKNAGCNHITCMCGAQFCYICGRRWGECRCQVIGEGNALRQNRAPQIRGNANRRSPLVTCGSSLTRMT